jgi:hypothetical protein
MKAIRYLLVFLFAFSLVGCGSDSSAQSKSPQSNYASMGENGVARTEGAIMTFTKSDFDEMMNYISAGNKDALHEMEDQGKLVVLPKDTKVTVVNQDWGMDLIEVKSGQYQGKRGYVTTESILKAK